MYVLRFGNSILKGLAAALCGLLGASCTCAEPEQIDQLRFSVYHPRAVTIYKPDAGIPPSNDRVFVYLALQNDSRPNNPMCFACWDSYHQNWSWEPFHNLIPVVSAQSVNAPILGQPDVQVFGIGGATLSPGSRFPEVPPDTGDFPLNEANFRRDFVLVLRPNRSITPPVGTANGAVFATGQVDVRFTVAPREGKSGKPALVSSFRIPVSLVNAFRPESMTPEPAE